jgi:hypothetical protein
VARFTWIWRAAARGLRGRGRSRSEERPGWVRIGNSLLYVEPSQPTVIDQARGPRLEAPPELIEALESPPEIEPTLLTATEEVLEQTADLTSALERAGELFKLLAGGADPRTLTRQIDTVLAAGLERFRVGDYRQALRVARVLTSVLLLAYRWTDLLRLLNVAVESARALGDSEAEAWALNELGSLAAASGSVSLAGELLGQAQGLYEQAGDHSAAELSAQNLAQLGQAPAAAPAGVVGKGVAAVTNHAVPAVATAIVLGVVGIGFLFDDGWYGLGGGGAEAMILVFEADTDQSIEAEFDEQRGFTSVPTGAVEPEGTVTGCNPLYLRVYVEFGDMKRDMTFAVKATAKDADFDKKLEAEWSKQQTYTEVISFFRVVNEGDTVSSGEPVPGGRWAVAVSVDGEELDRQEVTLTDSC